MRQLIAGQKIRILDVIKGHLDEFDHEIENVPVAANRSQILKEASLFDRNQGRFEREKLEKAKFTMLQYLARQLISKVKERRCPCRQ